MHFKIFCRRTVFFSVLLKVRLHPLKLLTNKNSRAYNLIIEVFLHFFYRRFSVNSLSYVWEKILYVCTSLAIFYIIQIFLIDILLVCNILFQLNL